MPGGRPTKYKPEYCGMLIEHMSKMHSFESFGATINVGRNALYEWLKAHAEFQDAKRIAREKLQLACERMGLGLMTGKVKGNVAAWIYYSKNVTHWRDNPDNDMEDGVTGVEFIDFGD